MAEAEGFEPSIGCPLPGIKTCPGTPWLIGTQ